ncbi:MAG TPA: hypothetical protein VIM48_03040 [Chthoniobacterales bacterium]
MNYVELSSSGSRSGLRHQSEKSIDRGIWNFAIGGLASRAVDLSLVGVDGADSGDHGQSFNTLESEPATKEECNDDDL